MDRTYPNRLLLILLLLLCWTVCISAQAATCDVDDDGDVDRNDISLIFAARNTPATGPEDPRDADGNGTINVLDGRQCVLQCTLINCDEPNGRPTAEAGPPQTVLLGATVSLDGSGSSDPDGDPLTFTWVMTSRPAGSMATLSDPNAVMPTFVADVAGRYVLQLMVNDGTQDSEADEVVISTQNSAPIANAEAPQTVEVGDTVQLDGSGSSDADDDPLTFQWILTSVPEGSTAILSDPNAVMPTFIADIAGRYVAQLIVNDGFQDSEPDVVTINTGNTVPIADAGSPQSVPIGDTVNLDGSGSADMDNDPLTFRWALTTVPAGSTATLSNPTATMPSFVADVAGTYVAQLIVNDGAADSDPDTVTITTANPVADAGPGQMLLVGATVTLDGSGSSSRDGRPLTYMWELISRPSGSTAELSDLAAVMPTFVADVEGDYVIELVVNDGTLSSPPDRVTITAEMITPPPQSLSCGDLVPGSLDAPAESDVFTFTGQTGDVVSIALAATDGFAVGEAAVGTLFSPSGTAVGFSVVSNGQRQREYTLPEDGSYTIRVSAFNLASTGSYNLGLQCL